MSPDPSPETATFTVAELCKLLRLGPTAVPVLAARGDLIIRLPGPAHGYCPQLDDVKIVGMRRGLHEDITLLDSLRREHPPEQQSSYSRALALGGVLRVLRR